MIENVYQSGPLRGLPVRGAVEPPFGSEASRRTHPIPAPAIAQPLHLDELEERHWIRRRLGLGPGAYAGDPDLNDPLAFPSIPDDAPAPHIETLRPDEDRGVTGLAGIVFAAFAVAYFGLRILGVIG